MKYSDKFLFCCLARSSETELVECLPQADLFSSCNDLLRIKFLSAMTWIFGLSALVGNLFVIFWRIWSLLFHVKASRSQRAGIHSILVTNLAIADSFMGVYMLIIASADVYYRDMYAYFAQEWQTSFVCKLAGFLSVLSSESSVFFLTVISVDRFLAIVFPFSRFNLKSVSVKVAVALVWDVTLTLSLIPVIIRDYFGDEFYGRSTVCLALPLTSDKPSGWQYSVALFIVINCVAFMIMLVCYAWIFIHVKRSSAAVKRRPNRAQEITFATRMSFLIFTDFCCWMPVIVMGLIALSGKTTISSEAYVWTAVFVLPLNSSLNPYLYTILTREMSKRLSTAGSKWKTLNSSVEMQGSKDEVLDEATPRIMILLSKTHHSAFQRNLLSTLLKQKNVEQNLQGIDLNQITSDLKKALQFLHDNRTPHGAITDDYIALDQISGVRRGLLLLPLEIVNAGMSECSEISLKETQVTYKEEFKQLEDIMERIKTRITPSKH